MFNIFKKNNENKRVYLDYAGAAPTAPQILASQKEFENLFANPSGIYKESTDVKNIIENSRKEILKYFDAVSQKVIFTQSATQSINIALFGILKKGDHLIISSIEHPATIECAKFLEKERGIKVTMLPVDELGVVDIKSLRENLKSNTKLVSVIYANNEIGVVQPIKEIGRIVNEHKRKNNTEIYFHTDATQAINYIQVSMNSNRLDMITFNGSKIYAGKGVAALIYDKNLKLLPIIFGGGQENNLWSGTEDVQSITRFAKALQIINDKDSESFKDTEKIRLENIKKNFVKELQKEIPEVIIWSKAENSLPNIINIGLPGFESDEMVIRLDNVGFAVSHKSACAALETGSGSYVLQALGATIKQSSENIRISMGRNTKEKDMNNLLSNIKTIYSKYKK